MGALAALIYMYMYARQLDAQRGINQLEGQHRQHVGAAQRSQAPTRWLSVEQSWICEGCAASSLCSAVVRLLRTSRTITSR